jgi:hypothetical protein
VSARTKLFAVVSLVALIVTVIWLALLIADTASAGPLNTFEQVLVHVSDLDALFYLTYANAALTVLATTLLFAAVPLLQNRSTRTGVGRAAFRAGPMRC